MSSARDRQGRRLRAGQTVQYMLRGAQVPVGWRDARVPVERAGLCGRAQVLRVLAPTEVRISLTERMGILGEDPGEPVIVHPSTLFIIK